VADLRASFERCFLAHPNVQPQRRVVVHFSLHGSGRVNAVLLEPDPGDVSLRRCVKNVLRGAGFARPPRDGLRVSVPLELSVP
jgi:hypothetical protein